MEQWNYIKYDNNNGLLYKNIYMDFTTDQIYQLASISLP